MASSSSNSSNKYGSLPEIYTNNDEDDIGEEEHGTYPIENTQYIVSTSEEKRKKCVNAFIPVIAFVVLMSTIAFALSRDFNHLYPGHSGNPSSTSKTNSGASKHSWVAKDVETTTTTAPESNVHVSSKPINNVKAQDNSHAGCSLHNACVGANLTGVCCPTQEDVFLECCN